MQTRLQNFTLSPRDSDDNPVDGITLDVQQTHVTVPVIEDPYSKILSISPIINEQPPPGYRITRIAVEPTQLWAAGRPQLVDALSTLSTEEITAHDLTQDQQISAPLVIPKGVVVKDGAGNQVMKVTVRISVSRTGTPPVGTGALPDTHSP